VDIVGLQKILRPSWGGVPDKPERHCIVAALFVGKESGSRGKRMLQEMSK